MKMDIYCDDIERAKENIIKMSEKGMQLGETPQFEYEIYKDIEWYFIKYRQYYRRHTHVDRIFCITFEADRVHIESPTDIHDILEIIAVPISVVCLLCVIVFSAQLFIFEKDKIVGLYMLSVNFVCASGMGYCMYGMFYSYKKRIKRIMGEIIGGEKI